MHSNSKEYAMLDWKTRGSDSAPRSEDTLDKRSARGGLLLRGLAALLAIYLLAALVVGWYWSQEPDLFPVQQHAQAAAQGAQRQMVIGYTTVETLKEVASTLLDKRGGYLSNDKLPPGLWLDNMPSWEYGVLVQVRDLSRALRVRSRNPPRMATWPRPSRASTSTTAAGRCRRRRASTARASSRWTATWRACPTRTRATRSSIPVPTT